MKITISYIDREEREATIIRRFVSSLLGGTKVNKIDRHSPSRHIYLTNDEIKGQTDILVENGTTWKGGQQ